MMVADSLDQVFRIQCANCGNMGSVLASNILAGVAVQCPHCQTPLVVPSSSPADTLREPTGPRAQTPTGSRAQVPTGRLKPVSYIGGTSNSRNVPTTANQPPAAPTATSEFVLKPESPQDVTKPGPEFEQPNSARQIVPQQRTSRDQNEPIESVVSDDSSTSNLSRSATEASGRTRTRRRRASSSGRSSSERSWNDIGVDGLPINADSDANEPEIETAGTRVRDVVGLLLAVAVSLMLTQAGLWWVAGIDPLGLAPIFSGWIPNVVPPTLAQ